MAKYTKLAFGTDKRLGSDRRKQRSFSTRSFLQGGRRGLIRRQEDTKRIFYADHYSPKLFAVIVSILFLSVIDALLTLFLIDNDAYELNPIMAYFLDVGPYTFFAIKYALTCITAISLLMFRNVFFRPLKIYTHSLFYFFSLAFMAVVAWELFLSFIVGISRRSSNGVVK